MTLLTPDAKALLAKTIGELRERLLRDLRGAAESAYHLAVPLKQAGLDEAHRIARERLEAWVDERVRALKLKTPKEREEARGRFFRLAEKEAAATLLNRLVFVRHLEALGLSKPAVVTGGQKSKGYRELREHGSALLGDETEGYATLLGLLFDELSLDLPGLFGEVGTTRLFPVPPATLHEVVDKLNDERLESAWTDDTTLGWVYQYWNDPEREALDAKIAGGGKVEPHEIASKTQMFTERYMVEWLLHNSLGLMWLCTCRKHGWTADAESVLPVLEERRAAWRAKRERGEVTLDALMPVDEGLEDRWKYFVQQPIPEDAVTQAPESVRALKLLDPACGSGHFLVIAFDLLAALYEEEARHRGETWTKRDVAESILENNLHGVDIDPRAVQIAAAALFLKAKTYAKDARPKRINLVAPALNLAQLPADDPALVRLRREMREEGGIPEELTNRLVKALAGVDYLGTLLKVDAEVEAALVGYEQERDFEGKSQGDLFGGFPAQQVKLALDPKKKGTVLEKVEEFLQRHGGAEDLGLRLDGEQIAAGVRFVRMVKEETYDLVIGNPPYQATSKMANAKRWNAKDLYAAFLVRGLDLARPGGMSAMLTMRGWMFLSQFTDLREFLLGSYDLRSLGDVDRGAFEDVPNEVLAAVMSVFRRAPLADVPSVAMQPTPLSDKSYDRERTKRKRAAVLAQVGRFEFETRGFTAITGQPLVYWWKQELLDTYTAATKLGETLSVRKGIITGDDTRFNRVWWESSLANIFLQRATVKEGDARTPARDTWAPTIKGGKDRQWIEPLTDIVVWKTNGLELKVLHQHEHGSFTKRIQSQDKYFVPGVAFSMIGSMFKARSHRFKSIFGNKGSSVFPSDIAEVGGILCCLNRSSARHVIESLNPGIGFEVGDVNRLPIFPVENADDIYKILDGAFTEHERARETSVEYVAPGPSPWRYAQNLAQRAVDRPAGDPLPAYEPTYDPPSPAAFVSHAFGLAIGRFPLDAEPKAALPHGILFLSAASERDSLDHPACAPLLAAWKERGATVGKGDDLRTWLRKTFFAYHRDLYENRPIYFPLSSAKKSFVAWVSIQRWQPDTLQTVLAEHLIPELRAIDGEIADLNKARGGTDKAARNKAEKRYADVQKLKVELDDFIALAGAVASKGPPPAGDKCPKREADAPYAMDLDDGVMVNSAGLWPLLEPQWKDPPKWWKELCTAEGRKDYDWAHLAARYFPARVAAKCVKDPSLAVAHGRFWALHPARAYAWELRLRDEIGDDFRIVEEGSDEARERFRKEHPGDARRIEKAERKRRRKKAKKLAARGQRVLGFPVAPAIAAEDGGGEDEDDDDEEEDDDEEAEDEGAVGEEDS